jgi:multicomponent Na+:H+ antiporter subunit B
MIDSVFLRFLARLMFPVLTMFSLFMLLRGHNAPGGGFVGGLVAASGLILLGLANDPDEMRQYLRIDFLRLMLWGLLFSALTGIVGLLLGQPFQKSYWLKTELGGLGLLELGTPALFDVGVYIVVLGVTSSVVLSMVDEGDTRGKQFQDNPTEVD